MKHGDREMLNGDLDDVLVGFNCQPDTARSHLRSSVEGRPRLDWPVSMSAGECQVLMDTSWPNPLRAEPFPKQGTHQPSKQAG